MIRILTEQMWFVLPVGRAEADVDGLVGGYDPHLG